MEPETQITFPIPTDNAAAAAVAEISNSFLPLYPLDQPLIQVPVKKGIKEGLAQFATLTIRRPAEKELIEREKKSRPGLAQITKHESQVEGGDATADLELATKLVVAIEGYNLHDGLPADEKRNVGPDNVQKIPATLRLAALAALYASTCEVWTLDLENGVAVVRQELGTGADPDFILLHTMDISDEALRTQFKRQTQQVLVNSKDPRVQRQSVRLNLAKIVEFYNRYFLDLEGASIGGEAYHVGLKGQALALLDAYYKRQVMMALTTALEEGLQD